MIMHRSFFLRRENIPHRVYEENERANHLLRPLHLQSSRCHKSAIIVSIEARFIVFCMSANSHDEEQRERERER